MNRESELMIFFSFGSLKVLFISLFLYISSFFFSTYFCDFKAFENFVFSSLTVMHISVAFFLYILLGVCGVSWICKLMFLANLGKVWPLFL